MRLIVKLIAISGIALALAGAGDAQNIALRYGQISSTVKTVSALQFHLAQRRGILRPRRNRPGNDPNRRRRGEHGPGA